MTDSRACNKCHQVKPLTDFALKKGGLYGRAAQCRACRKIYLAEYAQKNAERISRRMKIYYQATKPARQAYSKKWEAENKARKNKTRIEWAKNNPEKVAVISKRYRENNKDLVIAWRNQYLAKNKIKIKQRESDYRKNNREKILAAQKSWRLQNPEAYKIYNNLRRARLAQNSTFKVDRKEIKTLLAKSCAYCNEQSTEIDHIIPLLRGGSHSIGNLIGACKSCNNSKGPKTIMEWRVFKMSQETRL